MNGSYNITDLISITIGNSYLQKLLNSNYKENFLIINKFLTPISYSIINWENINSDKINNKFIMCKSNNKDRYKLVTISKKNQPDVLLIKK